MDGVETTTLKFDWTLRGLKSLFDSSTGESKSKVIKSPKFGGGRWQILFYPNSGTVNAEGHTFVSLYLACEPTAEEKEKAVDDKWTRDGVYKFTLEIKNLHNTTYHSKEAANHSFSYKNLNWGWTQFARRDAVYYLASPARQQDAVNIICTIISAAAPPTPQPLIPRHAIPTDLLESIGSLFDDPIYCDVEFILPRRGRNCNEYRKIYAARKLLKRVEYFDSMFKSGFVEGLSSDQPSTDLAVSHQEEARSFEPLNDLNTDSLDHFEDSDHEDDAEDSLMLKLPDFRTRALDPGDVSSEDHLPRKAGNTTEVSSPCPTLSEGEGIADCPTGADQTPRNVRAKLSHPSSPRARELALEKEKEKEEGYNQQSSFAEQSTPGPKKVRVVMKDMAYHTYRAVLYYIYTDTIVFAPLSSSFLTSAAPISPIPGMITSVSTPAATASESQTGLSHALRSSQSLVDGLSGGVNSRRDWIAEWEKNNPGRPRPCSAKAVYRLADRLDLPELKERAFQHIIKSLTVDNIAYEVFSNFSAVFEDVRKVQVDFFLDHWAEIRSSEHMRSVWRQIRGGRHPGFEEVWPLIASNLEFVPRSEPQ